MENFSPRKSFSHRTIFFQLGALVISSFVIIGICIIIFSARGNYRNIFSMLLSPFGGLIRYYSSKFNKNWTRFPLFTFLANVFGSIILVFANNVALISNLSPIWIGFLFGIRAGFCGSLTTVSTLVNELMNSQVPLKWRYRYFFTTVVVTQLFCVAIHSVFQMYRQEEDDD